MADLFQWWQHDLTILPNGDLLVVGSDLSVQCETFEGEQRVLRRLLTTAGTYIWHLDYGASLPQYIGKIPSADEVEGVILSQMLLEDVVATSPQPVVDVTLGSNGTLQADIKYVDNNVGKLVTTGFDLTA